MNYPNYYSRRGNVQSVWHRPGYASGVRRPSYGYRSGGAYGWQAGRQYGYGTRYQGAGNYGTRYAARYGGPQQRWSWLRRLGQGQRYWPQSYGYAQPAMGYAPQATGGYVPQAQGPGPQGPAPQWI